MANKLGTFLNALESRLSLWNLLNTGVLATSIALPAWAVKGMQLFDTYSPLSWVLAGFFGAIVWVIVRIAWVWARNSAVTAKYNAQILERGDPINPLAHSFEGKRIYVNDLALPSHPYIMDKTFVNCDIIGPANIYFQSNNIADPIRPPRVDGVWLGPKAIFYNGFIFINCVFKACSFQRITIFAGIENYVAWKDNPNVNWISIPPTQEQVAERLGHPITPPIQQETAGLAIAALDVVEG